MTKTRGIETNEQDSSEITLDKLFEQFHIIYGACSFYESQSLRTAKLKPLIEKALDQGIDINIQGPYNYTLLHRAIYVELYDIAEFLLKKGSSTKLKGLDGYTPLQLAIHEGYTEMVKLLITYGADYRDNKLTELVPDDKPELKAFLKLAIASQNINSFVVTTKDIEKLDNTPNSYIGSRMSKIVEITEEPEDFKPKPRHKFISIGKMDLITVEDIEQKKELINSLVQEIKDFELKLTGTVHEETS